MVRRSGQAGVWLFAGMILGVAPWCMSQTTDAFVNQQRVLEEQIRQQLDREIGAEQRALVDWGGSYSFFLTLNDDGINSSRTMRRHDGRLWTRVSLDEGTHEAYARGRLSFIDFNAGDSENGRDDDWEGPNLERGYYQFSLKNALKAYGHQKVDFDFRPRVGRQYVEFGTGYALSMPMDAAVITADLAGLQVTGLLGKSIGSWDDFDQSRPGWHSMDRAFYGVEARYKRLGGHEPFVYALWQDDQNNETPLDPFQNYEYDSHYIGFGSTGPLISNDLRYSTEWVFEGGRSIGNGRIVPRDEIRAWGWDMMVEYLMPAPMKPKFQIEYMFGSGDRDRLESPTNSFGGNRRDRQDTSFIGFGFRDTGLAFAPNLSNIHIWRLGGSFLPFEKIEVLKQLELGTDWFLYAKHHSMAAVSDSLADLPEGWLGWEVDWFANWRLTSDLTLTFRYGNFFPGSAYTDETARYFFLTGLTWSF